MVLGLERLWQWFTVNYNSSLALIVFIWAIVIAIISLFIWEFYKSTSKKNILNLNLSKYNVSTHPILKKFLALILYLLEYTVIIPLLITLWFSGLSVVLLFIARGVSIDYVLLLSAALIAAIRILSYYNEEISQDLGKLFPLITLSVFLLSPGSFDLNNLIERFNEIPTLFTNIFSYIFLVFVVEIVMRILYTFSAFFISEEKRFGLFSIFVPSPKPVKREEGED